MAKKLILSQFGNAVSKKFGQQCLPKKGSRKGTKK